MSDRDQKTREIMNELAKIRDPDSGQDLVSAGMARDVTHCDGAVKLAIALPNPALEQRDALLEEVRRRLRALPWVVQVNAQLVPAVSSGAKEEGKALGSVKNIIAVASGKGGVGKSTMAVNLAAGLAKAGASVGLLDADIYGPSIPMMLGTTDKPEPVEAPDGRRLFGPVRAHGVKLMSMGFLVEPERPVIWRGPMLHGALKQFFGDVDWGELDYLVIDLPPGTGDVSLTMAQSINVTGAVVVSTPQEVAMLDARKALNMFRETGIPVLGIVENMSGEIFGSGAAAAWAGREGVRFLGTIPLAAAVRVSGDAGVPAVLSKEPAVAAPFTAFVAAVGAAVAAQNAATPARKTISIRR